MSNDQCNICLEEYKNTDINTILNCGHQFHYGCIDNVIDKSRCCLCKCPIVCKAKILWTKDINFFNYIKPEDFHKVVFNTSINNTRINKVIERYQQRKFNELIKYYKQSIEIFTKENINLFYVRILEACNKNLNETKLYEFNYGDKILGVPAVFFIYGPINKGYTFFRENDMLSLIEYIQSKFDKNITIFPIKRNQRNQIWCKIYKSDNV